MAIVYYKNLIMLFWSGTIISTYNFILEVRNQTNSIRQKLSTSDSIRQKLSTPSHLILIVKVSLHPIICSIPLVYMVLIRLILTNKGGTEKRKREGKGESWKEGWYGWRGWGVLFQNGTVGHITDICQFIIFAFPLISLCQHTFPYTHICWACIITTPGLQEADSWAVEEGPTWEESSWRRRQSTRGIWGNIGIVGGGANMYWGRRGGGAHKRGWMDWGREVAITETNGGGTSGERVKSCFHLLESFFVHASSFYCVRNFFNWLLFL